MPRRRRGRNGGQGGAIQGEEGKKVRSEVRKMFLKYKCTNETCGKKWNSYHGWRTTHQMYQEECYSCEFGFGRITDVIEGMTTFDCYYCAGCDERWESYHPEEGEQQLPFETSCGNDCDPADTTLSGTQVRHSRNISFKCNRRKCASEWTSPYFGKEYSQKCVKCHATGEVMGSGVSNDDGKKGGFAGRRGGGGGHNVEGCDMCQELKPRGLTCTNKKKVVIEEILYPDGRLTTAVVGF